MASSLPPVDAGSFPDGPPWTGAVAAIADGHRLPSGNGDRGETGDLRLGRHGDGLLTRAAWVPGLGLGVKTVSVFPGNPNATPPRPSVQGVFVLFDDATGAMRGLVDGAFLTEVKTAADSVLGMRFLARPDSRVLLIVGAGAIAGAIAAAGRACLSGLEEILIWNRTPARAGALATRLGGTARGVRTVPDLADGIARADIVSAATFSSEPLIRGARVRPGTHVDLVGAFAPTMREADDDLVGKARVFVDSRHTALDPGEIAIPLARGVIAESAILGDLYDLCGGAPGRTDATQITLYKNGGGAHLDVMTGRYLLEAAGAPA